MKFQDITGRRFGKLTVIRKADRKNRHGHIVWIVRCDCGVMKELLGHAMTSGNTISCGCAMGDSHVVDITGQRFGRLTVVSPVRATGGATFQWNCKCDCGKVTKARTSGLKSGARVSCGCYTRELASQRRGPKSNFWKPDLTPEERENRRHTPGLFAWRGAVLRRDAYTCVLCSAKTDLVAHHLNSRRHHPEQELDVENGATLCSSCHIEFHEFVGGADLPCTRGDFEQYKACRMQEVG